VASVSILGAIVGRAPAAGPRHPLGLVRAAMIVAALMASACATSPSPNDSQPAGATGSPLPSTTASAGSTSHPAGTGLQGLVASALAWHLPFAISRAVAFADGASALLAGGLTNSGTTTAIFRISPSEGTVTLVGHLAERVHDSGGALVGGAPMVFGGGNIVAGTTVQSAGTGLGAVVGKLPAARADLSAVDLGGLAFVVGGGTPARLDRAILSTTDGVTFAHAGTLLVGVRYAAVAAVGGTILVVGGTDGTHDLADIQAFDPATGAVRVIGQLPHGLSQAAALVVAGHLLVVGGSSGGRAQDTIWEVDPVTGAVSVAGHLPIAVSDAAAVVVGGVGYLVGGVGGGGDKALTSIISIRIG
jgi:hypothetical protein